MDRIGQPIKARMLASLTGTAGRSAQAIDRVGQRRTRSRCTV